MKTSVLLRRFAPYFKPYAAIMLIDLVCAALTTVCELVLPLIVRFLTNRGTGGAIGLCGSSMHPQTILCRASGM